MVCDICGKQGARVRRVSRSYGKGQNLLVIQNVPVVRCPHCGETYLTAETPHEIERIKLHRQSFAEKRPVAVADFASPDGSCLKQTHKTLLLRDTGVRGPRWHESYYRKRVSLVGETR